MTVTIRVDLYEYTVGGMSRTADARPQTPFNLEWADELPDPVVGMRIVVGGRTGTIRGVTVDLTTGHVVLNVDEYRARPQTEEKP